MITMISREAVIDKTARIGRNLSIWDFSEIRENAIIGDHVSLGRNVYVGPGVIVGDFSRVQNNVNLYEPAKIGNYVFIGPNSVLTNDKFPSILLDGIMLKTLGTWAPLGVEIEDFVSIGASVTIIGGIRIGHHSMVGAGSIVTKDVPCHALVFGNPAKIVARIGKQMEKLEEVSDQEFVSPITGERYEVLESGCLKAKINS